MFGLWSSALSLMWAPGAGWRRLRSQRLEWSALLVYCVVLALLPLFSRGVGHILGGRSVESSLAESMLFCFFQVGTASGSGVVLAATARRLGLELSDGVAQRMVLLSATPIWLLSVLYIIPAPSQLWPYVLLGSLSWAALILYRGIHEYCALSLRSLTVAALSASAAWLLSSAILSQILYLLLLPR
ncbi:MAG: hypothetical protein RBU37_22620 [Myxococcota bacterium]|jgi:hypothetical protein|nr:hypothetical protein [Myxococcota bacterium]